MTPKRHLPPWTGGDSCLVRTLLLGLGNRILRDDGVGIHAVRRLLRLSLPGCMAAEACGFLSSAKDLLQRADKIIAFDALHAGKTPGTVYALRVGEAQGQLAGGSLQGIGLPWTLRALGKWDAEIVVIAAEPEVIEFGTNLSPRLEAAVPLMVEAAQALISSWQDSQAAEVRRSRTDLAGVLSESPHYRSLFIPCTA